MENAHLRDQACRSWCAPVKSKALKPFFCFVLFEDFSFFFFGLIVFGFKEESSCLQDLINVEEDIENDIHILVDNNYLFSLLSCYKIGFFDVRCISNIIH